MGKCGKGTGSFGTFGISMAAAGVEPSLGRQTLQLSLSSDDGGGRWFLLI